ncbi:MAG: LysR family transcriptional regulator, partial [Stutzerimonas stutzeri]
ALAEMGNVKLPHEMHLGQFLASIVAQEVRSGRAEIGFSSLPLDTPGLEVLRLYSAPDAVALREDDDLASLDVIPLSAFAGRSIATMLNPLRFQLNISRALATEGIETGPVIRTNIAYGAMQIVQKTGIAAVIDPITAYCVHLPEVVVRPIEVNVPFYWGVLSAERLPLSPAAQALVEAVEAVAARSIAGFKKLNPDMAGNLVTSLMPGANNGSEP